MAAVNRVRHSEIGFIHRVGDKEELARHMTNLVENPQRIVEMGAKARHKAEEWPRSRHLQTIMDVL